MKLSPDMSVLRLTHEGINNFASLSDVDNKRIQILPSVCNNSIYAIESDATNNIVAEYSVTLVNFG